MGTPVCGDIRWVLCCCWSDCVLTGVSFFEQPSLARPKWAHHLLTGNDGLRETKGAVLRLAATAFTVLSGGKCGMSRIGPSHPERTEPSRARVVPTFPRDILSARDILSPLEITWGGSR